MPQLLANMEQLQTPSPPRFWEVGSNLRYAHPYLQKRLKRSALSRTALKQQIGRCSVLQLMGTLRNTQTPSLHTSLNDVVPRVSVRTFPNQKPWVNGNVRAKLRARSSAYNSGDPEALRKSRCDLRRAIRDGKRDYRDKLESTYLSSDPRRMWGGLRHLTGYKGRNSSDDQPAASLPDDLNTFYARFKATHTLPSARLAEDRDDCTLSLTVADVRRELQRVKPITAQHSTLLCLPSLSLSSGAWVLNP